MGFQVNFYTVSKKPKSTYTPQVSSGTTYTCDYKSGSSVITPRLVLRYNGEFPYNYAYIPTHKRWYFVNNISWDNGFWVVNLSVDVLASYKNQIREQSFYILRSASKYNGDIVDNLYPTVGLETASSEASNYLYNVETGCYCIGLLGQGGNADGGLGAVNYYIMGPSAMNNLMNKILDQDDSFWSFDGISIALAKSFFNPSDYIVSCTWLPVEPLDFLNNFQPNVDYIPGSAIEFGWWTLPATGNKIINATFSQTFAIDVPKHPQTDAKGSFVNLAPYTRLHLFVQPWGFIDLDTGLFRDYLRMTVNTSLDLTSGDATLEVKRGKNYVAYTATTRVGVPVMLSNTSTDVFGGIASVASAGVTALANPVAGAMALAGGIGSVLDSFAPQKQRIGSTGSRAIYKPPHKPTIYATFYLIADGDDANEGRPLSKSMRLRDLYGYLQVYNADAVIDGTKSEVDELNSLLESGIYYE